MSEAPRKFQNLLEAEYIAAKERDTLKILRKKAWERYLKLGLPSKTNEQYRYIKTAKLLHEEYTFSPPLYPVHIEEYILPECQYSALVFVNGKYAPEHSRTEGLKQAVISPLQEAAKKYSAFLTNQWNLSLKGEADPFASLNGALHEGGIFLMVPPNCTLEAPIQILNLVNTGQSAAIVQPRLHVYSGKNSESSLIFRTVDIESKWFGINQATEISLDEDARMNIVQMSGGTRGWHLDALRAVLKKGSFLRSICLTTGSETTRHDYRVALTGEHAEADLKGVCYLRNKNEAHLNILMEHQAPCCRSNQQFKTVLKDISRASFEGKIYVDQAAQKTEAYQLNSNLLLDDRALAYSKPNLEIFADDVKASHGATVGQLDEEQLFYLRTRGFTEYEAKQILIEGYCREIVDEITYPSIQRLYRFS